KRPKYAASSSLEKDCAETTLKSKSTKVVVKKVIAASSATLRRWGFCTTRVKPPERTAGEGRPEAARANRRWRPAAPAMKEVTPQPSSSAAHIGSSALAP